VPGKAEAMKKRIQRKIALSMIVGLLEMYRDREQEWLRELALGVCKEAGSTNDSDVNLVMKTFDEFIEELKVKR
jgi:hypothetical protein